MTTIFQAKQMATMLGFQKKKKSSSQVVGGMDLVQKNETFRWYVSATSGAERFNP